MKFKTWLAGSVLFTAMASHTALAADVYFAYLGPISGFPPIPASAGTGIAYLAMNNDNLNHTYTVTHNVTNQTVFARAHNPAEPVANTFPGQQPVTTFWVADGTFSNFNSINQLRAGQHFLELRSGTTSILGGFFNQVVFPTVTDNRNRASLAGILNAYGGAREFNRLLVELAQVPTTSLFDAYDQMSGRTLYSQSVQVLDTMFGFQNSLFSHASEPVGLPGTFNFFVKGGYGVGKRSDTRDQAGAKTSRPYVLAGIDHPFLPNAVAGIAVGYAAAKDKFTGDLGSTSVSTIAGFGYVSANINRLVVQGVLGYGKSEIGTSRAMPTLRLTPTSRHNGDGWSVAAKATLPYSIAPATTLGPYVMLDTQNASIDSYEEEGFGRFSPRAFKDKDLGVEVGAALRQVLGPAAQLRAEVGFRQSLDQGEKAVQTLYVGAAALFNTAILGRSPMAGRASLAVSGAISPTASVEVGYQGYMSGRMNSHAIEARMSFRLGG